MTLDLLVRNATIVDGSGAPGFPGSVGVSGDRIVWMGGGDAPDAARTIEGAGRVAAPGFVDVHNHSDVSAFVDPWMRSTLRQGVTTVIVGNCGASPWPLAGWGESVLLAGANPELPRPSWRSWGDYLDALDDAEPAVNVATLVGHGSLRRETMGLERRPPEADELETMRSMAAEAIREGAFVSPQDLSIRQACTRASTTWWRLPRRRPRPVASTRATSGARAHACSTP